MSLEIVFLLLGFALLSAILVAAVCSVVYAEAQRSFREWVNTAISIVTVVVLAWTAGSIVAQVTEMQRVYPEIQKQSKAMAAQVDSYIAAERARMFVVPTGVQRSADKDPAPRFTYTIANMGRTATVVTGILAQCEVAARPIDPSSSYDESRLSQSYTFIANVAQMQMPECVLSHPLTEDDFSGLAAGSKIILFKGYILYQDVLGETWKKHFGMYGNGDGKFFHLPNADAYSAEEKVTVGN